ncbi:hypothetical protein GJR95_40980 [Spirosoma endbachense]|uniref:Uncharacterized protein n=1 Tax=Spirosoma endbachense TaxID=2666025 RepID=A0A6P1WAL9_9BACT|nr:hypothetical protein GJR95_40980 [Spirosoma endbachense]
MDGLPDGLYRYTILQISDLHAGAGIPRHYIDQVVQKALNQPMDIIVLTGDIAEGNFSKYQHRVEPISQLKVSHESIKYLTFWPQLHNNSFQIGMF